MNEILVFNYLTSINSFIDNKIAERSVFFNAHQNFFVACQLRAQKALFNFYNLILFPMSQLHILENMSGRRLAWHSSHSFSFARKEIFRIFFLLSINKRLCIVYINTRELKITWKNFSDYSSDRMHFLWDKNTRIFEMWAIFSDQTNNHYYCMK